jgi:hypothetical protein
MTTSTPTGHATPSSTLRLVDGTRMRVDLDPERLELALGAHSGRIGLQDADTRRWTWVAIGDIASVERAG